ncbi:hypothetical protein ICN10_06355 [Polynucleobacter sp. 86C-FISCH]|uniref:hypothetical protein n=1 Tax=Polynucleobacter sp. 86C-FISCH TaxID=2689101 RepID=UPI001C0B4B42|nr:hypothetical protein [Polynucleobacter sp. 86C-FISCH]MBU3596022.1 hypothetical protein [Polynucleobacter sp. 86C-FISCH]
MHILNIKLLTKCLGAVAIAFAIAACGGGGSSGSSASAAAPSATDSSGGNTVSTAIDPTTGSVAAADVTCQGACVSLSADAGTSTE